MLSLRGGASGAGIFYFQGNRVGGRALHSKILIYCHRLISLVALKSFEPRTVAL